MRHPCFQCVEDPRLLGSGCWDVDPSHLRYPGRDDRLLGERLAAAGLTLCDTYAASRACVPWVVVVAYGPDGIRRRFEIKKPPGAAELAALIITEMRNRAKP